MRKPLMAGNWKMNLNHLEAIAVTQKLSYSLEDRDYDAIDVAVIPACANILENHPDVSEIISYDKKKNDSGILGFTRMLSCLRQK